MPGSMHGSLPAVMRADSGLGGLSGELPSDHPSFPSDPPCADNGLGGLSGAPSFRSYHPSSRPRPRPHTGPRPNPHPMVSRILTRSPDTNPSPNARPQSLRGA